jgi:NADPH:quinone reductase-like Zn-dependent oxidoreductase
MGLVDGTNDGIGLESSGIVRQIGPDVEGLQVGDRVLIYGRGCLSTRYVTSAKLCAKLSENLSFEEAATMPCVYSTVIYALMTVGKLEKGQVRKAEMKNRLALAET